MARVSLALALALAAAYFTPVRRAKSDRKPGNFVSAGWKADAGNSPFGHPYYRYSVIPGGVHSPAELKRALANDQVAAEHYAGFNADQARMVTASSDRFAYASYRVGDRVYWTSRPLKIARGETLLTDGVHYIRARCGNRLEDHPAQQSAELEPTEKALNTPVVVETADPEKAKLTKLEPAPDVVMDVQAGKDVPEVLLASVPRYEPPAVIANFVPTPDMHIPIFVQDGEQFIAPYPLFLKSEPGPVTAIPEPATAALTGLVLISFAAYLKVRMRTKNR